MLGARWAGSASDPGAPRSRRWPTGSTSTDCSCGWRRASPTAIRCAPARCAGATPTPWWCRAGWTLDDRREPTPRLFRPAPRRRRRRARPHGARPSAGDAPSEQLALRPSPRSPASRSPTTIPTPRGDPVDARLRRRRRPRRRARRPQPAAGPGLPRHRPAAADAADARSTVDADHRGRHARRRCSSHVATLDRYPPWMRLVHRVEPVEPDDGRPAWRVELRARVGLFARSKQLRMVRTVLRARPAASASSASRTTSATTPTWVLTATVDDVDGGAERSSTDLDLHRHAVDGAASCSGCSTRRSAAASDALRRLVSAEPTR